MAMHAVAAVRVGSGVIPSLRPLCSSSSSPSPSSSSSPQNPSPTFLPAIPSSMEPQRVARLALDPSAAYANIMWFRGPYNVQIDVEDNEASEAVVRKFRRAVSEANVIGECQRRRFHEQKQDIIKRKQKERALARRRSRPSNGAGRPFRPNDSRGEASAEPAHVDEDDNWGAKPDL